MTTDNSTEQAREALIADLMRLQAQVAVLKAKAEKPGHGAEVLKLWSEGRVLWTLAISHSAGVVAAEEGKRRALDAAARGEAAQVACLAAPAVEPLPRHRAPPPTGKAAAARDYD